VTRVYKAKLRSMKDLLIKKTVLWWGCCICPCYRDSKEGSATRAHASDLHYIFKFLT
jgi:hypothetical protein